MTTLADMIAPAVTDYFEREQDKLSRMSNHHPLARPLNLVHITPAETWPRVTTIPEHSRALGYAEVFRNDSGFGFYYSAGVIADRLAIALTTAEGIELDKRCLEHGNDDSGRGLGTAYLIGIWHITLVMCGRWDSYPDGTSTGVRWAEAFAHLATHSPTHAEIITWMDGTFRYSPPTLIGP